MDKHALLKYFDDWVETFHPPVYAPRDVLQVRPRAGGGFKVHTDHTTVTADVVVVATATHQRPRIPAVRLSRAVTQIHVVDYKCPEMLPSGRVLVIGAGQSGCQVVEDLLRGGREVFLAVGRCRTLPRRYRGRDVIDWQQALGLLDRRPDDLPDPAMRFAPGDPQMTGRDGGRTTVRLADFAKRGVQLLGRLRGCSRSESSANKQDQRAQQAPAEMAVLCFEGPSSVRHATAEADRFLLDFIDQVDAHCSSSSSWHCPRDSKDEALVAAAQEAVRNDAEERLAGRPTDSDAEQTLPLSRISTVIWATGFEYDFNWLVGFGNNLLDKDGYPITEGGTGSSPAADGLHFCGLNWMNARKSGILLGVAADAEAVAGAIARRVSGAFGGGRSRL